MTTQSAAPLNYAPPPPWHRRKRLRRWALLTGIALVCLLGATQLRRVAFHVELFYQQQRCLAYSAPADQVVFARDSSGSTASIVPDCWTRFYSLLSPPGFRSQGTVFLHERTTPSGKRRLVAVDFIGLYISNRLGAAFYHRVFLPTGLFRRPEEAVEYIIFGPDRDRSFKINEPLRFFAGQIDPADESHFTIRYEAGEEKGIIDGWLRDGENVVLEFRR